MKMIVKLTKQLKCQHLLYEGKVFNPSCGGSIVWIKIYGKFY